MKTQQINPYRAKFSRAIATALMAFSFSGLTLPVLAAGNANPGIIPPQASPAGHTYAEWAAMWWQWTLGIPADTSPLLDSTGEFCDVDQSGHVWFLAGNTGGVSVRECAVPAGKALFFPIINTVWINLPDYGDDPWSDEQRAFARSVIGPFVDNAFDLSCTIDGVQVQNLEAYRAATADGAEYPVTLPDNNILGFLPAGTYGPTVDDGIYLMLAPLTPGQHTIHFTSASTGSALGDFSLDVTYYLTVQ